MIIQRLLINDFRNLEYVDIEPCPGFNFICGPNGSGKTSILEAIHYLALVRSFRANATQYLIRQGTTQFNLFASLSDELSATTTNIGLGRVRGQAPIIKLNATQGARIVDLIDHICVQIIHPQGVDLITKEAEGRRNFIDWGVYYTNPNFKPLWLQYRKALKQRNAILRQHMDKPKAKYAQSYLYSQSQSPLQSSYPVMDEVIAWPDLGQSQSMMVMSDFDELSVWNESIASLSEQISQMRLEYLESLQEILQDIVVKFLPHFKLKFELNFGWEKGQDLRSLLAQNLERDKALGYTLYGCHRADLKIRNHTISAGATLSRGQLKMLVYAMRLAQGMLLKQQANRACVFLIDDLNSELDDNAQRVLLDTLLQCQHQVFISNIQQDVLIPKDRSKVFKLDRGMVQGHTP